ncbi:MAG: ATP-binding cassette domain-containing protein [Muribaculaceae bacterium]|nr:ATP-binding cassette domain-containing protein [Muribaculaceae bacterium]
MNSITIENTLPAVFAGSESEPPVSTSCVWLKNLTFSRPDYYMIEAESGTGKSSLCSFIYGSRLDYSGRILFDNEDTRTFSIDRWSAIRREAIAYLPQEMMLFPELTVLENIAIKNKLTNYKSDSEIDRMLQMLEIDNKRNTPARLLSVGQQQRVAIIRSLCQPFDFLIVDEPVSHLDARNNSVVAALIDSEASARGAAVIATSVGNKISLPNLNILTL